MKTCQFGDQSLGGTLAMHERVTLHRLEQVDHPSRRRPPAGTPLAIIQRLSAEINKLMKSPSFQERLDASVLIPVFDTPDEFAAFLKKERARYAEVIRRNNIVAD